MTYDNSSGYVTRSRKIPTADRTSSFSHPKHASSPLEERRRIAKWLRAKGEDKECMKNVKFTPNK